MGEHSHQETLWDFINELVCVECGVTGLRECIVDVYSLFITFLLCGLERLDLHLEKGICVGSFSRWIEEWDMMNNTA